MVNYDYKKAKAPLTNGLMSEVQMLQYLVLQP